MTDTEILGAIREIVEEWNNGQFSPRRAMHSIDAIASIIEGAAIAVQPPAASQPGWQPIATAPTNGMRIILGIAGTTVYPHDELCHLATWDGVNCHPYVPNAWTHWHALPAAPHTKDSK